MVLCLLHVCTKTKNIGVDNPQTKIVVIDQMLQVAASDHGLQFLSLIQQFLSIPTGINVLVQILEQVR